MAHTTYPQITHYKTREELLDYTAVLGVSLPFDPEVQPAPEGVLAQPYCLKDGRQIGNRFCIQPMEGWDGTRDGKPTEFTVRRWRNFGLSGAKLIWGGEAAAVRADGRGNPAQLVIGDSTWEAMARLREALVAAHRASCGSDAGLVVGLQLTHSGRYARPSAWDRAEPLTVFYPGSKFGKMEPYASLRLKAYRRGQQDIEYLILLAAKHGWDRDAVTDAVAGALDLSTKVSMTSEEDAGSISFGKVKDADMDRARLRIVKALLAR